MKQDLNLKELQKIIPYQWRIQSFSKNKPQATVIPYIDARDAMRLLDDVVGQENWQDQYTVINGQMFAGVGIYVNGQWVWKWDTGTESQTEKEKGIVSDSFKRACVKWGIGRFLYDIDIQYIDTNEKKTENPRNYPYPVDKNGKRIWDLTEHMNTMLTQKPAKAKTTIVVEYAPESLQKEIQEVWDALCVVDQKLHVEDTKPLFDAFIKQAGGSKTLASLTIAQAQALLKKFTTRYEEVITTNTTTNE